MDENQIELRNVLGLYYDSSELKMDEVPDTISLVVNGQMMLEGEGHFFFKLTANYAGKEHYNVNSKDEGCIERIVNNFVPSFVVPEKESEVSNRDSFDIQISQVPSSYQIISITKPQIKFSEIMQEVIKVVGSLPIAFSLCLKIKRTTNQDFRKFQANKKRLRSIQSYSYGNSGLKSVEEFFAEVCGTGRDTSRYFNARYGNRNFTGIIRKRLSEYDKPVLTFAIEYLWGKRINKSSKAKEVIDMLALLDYNDFGIKDAAVMINFIEKIRRSYNYNELIAVFSALKIKPKTDLKRWKKFLNPDSINLLNNLLIGEK